MNTIPAGYLLIGYHDDGTPMYRQPKRKPLGKGDRDALAVLKADVGTSEAHALMVKGYAPKKPKPRIRQPKSLYDSELEKEWHERMKSDPRYGHGTITPKGIRFRLASGLHYTPDFVLRRPESYRLKCFEVKGPRKAKGVSKGVAVLKMAAASWPEFTFVFVWKEDGQWQEQVIVP